METQSIVLLAINVAGGALVIGSYLNGFITHPKKSSALWGGVPQSIRPVYGISMILAALGYFAFIYYIIFRLDSDDVRIAGSFGYSIFYAIFLCILLPSALWMPLTYSMIKKPDSVKWMAVRIVLIAVGFSSCVLIWALFNLQKSETGLSYWFAIAGSLYFAFHTAVLDMIVWPVLFKK